MADLTPSETTIASANGNQPEMGGGLPVIGYWTYWTEKTLDLKGGLLWKTLLHKSACLSCAWGTGGQKGGFQNEDEENLLKLKNICALLIKWKLMREIFSIKYTEFISIFNILTLLHCIFQA